MFTNQSNLDFSYSPESPCIDSGDPEIIDPDGTVSDIGANYFSQEISYSMNIMEGWNLIGLSVSTDNSYYDELFENSIENSLFYFNEDGVYTAVDNLQPGYGYWLRFELPYNANISGQVINSLTVNLVEGWNLISGISNSIILDLIMDPENLIIPSTLFRYDGNYTDTETIDPGYGYWLRSNGTGQIILNY